MGYSKYLKKERILELQAQGLNQAQVAKLLGCSQTHVGTYSRTYGILWPRTGPPKGSLHPGFKDGLSRSSIERLTREVLSNARRNLITCERCGYIDFTKQELPRHHKDRNRANNIPDNLEVLCWGCHNQEHMKERHRDSSGKLASVKS